MGRFSFFVTNVSDEINNEVQKAKIILKDKGLSYSKYLPYIMVYVGVQKFIESPDKIIAQIMPKINN